MLYCPVPVIILSLIFWCRDSSIECQASPNSPNTQTCLIFQKLLSRDSGGQTVVSTGYQFEQLTGM